jgi:hypothetical protein
MDFVFYLRPNPQPVDIKMTLFLIHQTETQVLYTSQKVVETRLIRLVILPTISAKVSQLRPLNRLLSSASVCL